jgi:hypothetical protein
MLTCVYICVTTDCVLTRSERLHNVRFLDEDVRTEEKNNLRHTYVCSQARFVMITVCMQCDLSDYFYITLV